MESQMQENDGRYSREGAKAKKNAIAKSQFNE
jgi:hypothetical protein